MHCCSEEGSEGSEELELQAALQQWLESIAQLDRDHLQALKSLDDQRLLIGSQVSYR